MPFAATRLLQKDTGYGECFVKFFQMKFFFNNPIHIPLTLSTERNYISNLLCKNFNNVRINFHFSRIQHLSRIGGELPPFMKIS